MDTTLPLPEVQEISAETLCIDDQSMETLSFDQLIALVTNLKTRA